MKKQTMTHWAARTAMTAILLFVCALSSVVAQTIGRHDKFWDGDNLWEVQDRYTNGTVILVGTNGNIMTLEAVDSKTGKYRLAQTGEEASPIPCAEFGWKAQYIRQEGMNFIVIRKPDGNAMWSMVLTPDTYENCVAQQQEIDNKPGFIADWILLNRHYLSRMAGRQHLRLMRNEILARHGYRFKSPDLKKYFESKLWYKPCKDNSQIKLNIIEQHNIQLIKSEEEDL